MNSDTPRTDAAEAIERNDYENSREAGDPPFNAEGFRFARKLERELNEANADKQVVDWMEENTHSLHYGLDCKVCVRGEDGMEFKAETWRAAINAARGK